MTIAGLDDHVAADATDTLKAAHAKRGYALSYHKMFAAHAPDLLAAYDNYYRELTLRPRALSDVAKETVWIALQAATREHHGMIHLRRAVTAGMSPDAIADALAIAAAVETWPVLAFGDDYWKDWTPLTIAIPRYERMFAAAIGDTHPATAEITAAVCHAARRTHEAEKFHITRAFAAGATQTQLAEALGFLLLPAGGPCLIDAVQAWADAHTANPTDVPSPYASAGGETA